MKQVIVFGANFCAPCQILKEWLDNGGLNGMASHTYVDGHQNPAALAQFRSLHGIPELGSSFPGVVILNNARVQNWKNGGTQTWIMNEINRNPTTVVTQEEIQELDNLTENQVQPVFPSGPVSTPDDAPPPEFVLLEWIQDDENEMWVIIGAILLLALLAWVLSRFNWI